MQKDSWNIINMYQVLNIEILQVMEPKKEKKLTKKFIMFPLWCFKDKKLEFKALSTHHVAPFIMFAPSLNIHKIWIGSKYFQN